MALLAAYCVILILIDIDGGGGLHFHFKKNFFLQLYVEKRQNIEIGID